MVNIPQGGDAWMIDARKEIREVGAETKPIVGFHDDGDTQGISADASPPRLSAIYSKTSSRSVGRQLAANVFTRGQFSSVATQGCGQSAACGSRSSWSDRRASPSY